MATIVKYIDQQPSANRYPQQIISPPQECACCFSDMEELGPPQTDARWVYQGYLITPFQDAGDWWARARGVQKDAGGDRPVLGGPWKSKPEARTAAEAFCDSGKAG